MTSTNTTFDSLPYIDAEPTAADRTAAQALIDAELAQDSIDTSDIHPSLPTESDFLDHILELLIEIEESKKASNGKLKVLDMSRYEEVETPSPSASIDEVKSAVERAAVSSVYLAHRQQNLEQLQDTGKEEWLAGNAGVQGILEGLENELAGTKEGIDRLAHERQSAQEGVKGEVEVLEQSWRGGVERVLRTEVAAEQLRAQILERRREGGGVVN